MKRKHLFVILLLLSLFVLVGCGEKVQSSGTENNSQQTEDEQLDEIAQDNVQETEDDKESEPILEDGWVALTNEELDWFNQEFFNNPDEPIVNYFLDSEFLDVKDVDLYRLFYDLPRTEAESLTEQELLLLENAGVDMALDIQKVPVEYMDEVLEKYANISFEETNESKPDYFVYLEEYDAYYMSHGDCHVATRLMISGRKNENGIVCLKYEGYDFSYYEVTLMPHGNGYYFVSNMVIEEK